MDLFARTRNDSVVFDAAVDDECWGIRVGVENVPTVES